MREVTSTSEVTQLLRAWGNGNGRALDRLAPLVYDELHSIAHTYMLRERPGHTLQTTALVNEAYLRLVDVHQASFEDRAHFFALCARAMRRILVDHARSRGTLKRGAGQVHLQLEEALGPRWSPEADVLELDEALNRLEELDLRKAQVVELRFFGGLSVDETAEALKVSRQTVMRDWKLARAWLHRELTEGRSDGA